MQEKYVSKRQKISSSGLIAAKARKARSRFHNDTAEQHHPLPPPTAIASRRITLCRVRAENDEWDVKEKKEDSGRLIYPRSPSRHGPRRPVHVIPVLLAELRPVKHRSAPKGSTTMTVRIEFLESNPDTVENRSDCRSSTSGNNTGNIQVTSSTLQLCIRTAEVIVPFPRSLAGTNIRQSDSQEVFRLVLTRILEGWLSKNLDRELSQKNSVYADPRWIVRSVYDVLICR